MLLEILEVDDDDSLECRKRGASRLGLGRNPLGQRREEPGQHCVMQPFLGAEVIGDGPEVGAGLRRDLADRRAGVPPLGEQPLGGAQQPVPGGIGRVHTVV